MGLEMVGAGVVTGTFFIIKKFKGYYYYLDCSFGIE
jgi:hypothetical protein